MKISNEVLAVLSAAQVDGHQLVLVGQLERKLYEQTNKVLEAAGGKWNRKAKAHVFDAPAEDRIDEIILSGSVVVPKDEFNYFPTPPALVVRLIALADVRPGMDALEPSAGQGAIVTGLLDAGAVVMAYEVLEANADALVKAVRAHPKRGMTMVVQQDFLTEEPLGQYDRVVMNPPFAKQADIKHVTHAVRFLAPGGRLVAIMSAGVVFRQDKRATEFRALVARMAGVIEPLPAGSFDSSGTGVSTVVVTMNEQSRGA